MSDTPVKPPRRARQVGQSKPSKARGRGAAKTSPIASEAQPQPVARSCDACGRQFKTDRGLAGHTCKATTPAPAPVGRESNAEALERTLRDLNIVVTPVRALVVSQLRSLAEGLDLALPGDRPKISKQLQAVWEALKLDVNPEVPDDDWTRSGTTEVRDTA